MWGPLTPSNHPSAKDFSLPAGTVYFGDTKNANPQPIKVWDLRYLQHPPALPDDAPARTVSLPSDVVQQLEHHGVLWAKQKPWFGHLSPADRLKEVEKRVKEYIDRPWNPNNPINVASSTLVKVLYGDTRVGVPYFQQGAARRGPASRSPYAPMLHTDSSHDGPSDADVEQVLQFSAINRESVNLESLEVLSQWSLIAKSQQRPLVLQAHTSLARFAIQERYSDAPMFNGAGHFMVKGHSGDLYLYLQDMDIDDLLVFKQFSKTHPQRSRLAHFAANHPDFPVTAEEIKDSGGSRYSLEKRTITFEKQMPK